MKLVGGQCWWRYFDKHDENVNLCRLLVKSAFKISRGHDVSFLFLASLKLLCDKYITCNAVN